MFETLQLNFLSILVAAILGMIIGALWYSPFLFGKMWMRLMKISPKDIRAAKNKEMTSAYIVSFASLFASAFILAVILSLVNITAMLNGILLAMILWLGFMVPLLINTVLWENKPWKLFLLNASHHFTVLIVMSIVLTLWQ
ncbi:MAG: DUF1761 domain-containing protein [Nanoarchaeota archaeon]|nr:DUF1761 domain-containing protein [Nanoarchaeota archaeon]